MLGFSVGYFQTQWQVEQGPDVTFGLQAVVIVSASFLMVICHIWGHKLRAWAGPVHPLRI